MEIITIIIGKTNINNNLSCTTRDILVWDNVTEQPMRKANNIMLRC